MSEQNEPLKSGHPEGIPSEPIRLESEGVFNSELLDSAGYPLPPEIGELLDNPLNVVARMLGQYLESIRPRIPEPIKSEHKVKIFWLHRSLKIEEVEQIETTIEDLLNDSYCCHIPTVCNDFLIMDFARRKENKDDNA